MHNYLKSTDVFYKRLKKTPSSNTSKSLMHLNQLNLWDSLVLELVFIGDRCVTSESSNRNARFSGWG